MKLLALFFFFTLSLFAHVIDIDEGTSSLEILSKTQIYVDTTQELSYKDIVQKEFVENSEDILGFGYSPKLNLWIKIELHNTSPYHLERVLEYANPMTTHVYYYDNDGVKNSDGLLHINSERKTINPHFLVELEPNEVQTLYIQTSSNVTTLIAKLHLWEKQSFYEKETKHQVILALFFGAMLILGVYNLFIFFFTRDISYLYYVMYIFGVIAHQIMYVGIGNIYFLSQEMVNLVVEYAVVLVAFPIYSLALFTKSFLQIQQYKYINYLFNILLIIVPLSVVFFSVFDLWQEYRNLFNISLGAYLLVVTIYATLRRNRQAYFILFGWFMVVSASLMMYLSSAGISSLYTKVAYVTELAFVLEAVIFSIALANKINYLQQEKNEANEKLIAQQQNETQRLEQKVQAKTRDLKHALDDKEVLLKELNHRVKNNMQTMLSLIRFQIDDTDNEEFQEKLTTIQNRISAMNHLHELLYQKDSIAYVNADEYIGFLAQELEDSFDMNVDIFLDVRTNFKAEDAVYCGLIINEIVTNSYKYAFPQKEGEISIEFYKEDGKYILKIEDDGVGFDDSKPRNSLGLTLVTNLVTKKLHGDFSIQSLSGVKVRIEWSY